MVRACLTSLSQLERKTARMLAFVCRVEESLAVDSGRDDLDGMKYEGMATRLKRI